MNIFNQVKVHSLVFTNNGPWALTLYTNKELFLMVTPPHNFRVNYRSDTISYLSINGEK